MQQYQIKITRLAERDLENIGDYIAEQLLNPVAAKSMIRGIRRTYYKKYKIYYVVDEKASEVYIIRILHMLTDSRTQLHQMFEG